MALRNEQQHPSGDDSVNRSDVFPSFILREGMNHNDVVDLKIKLNWLGYGKSRTTKKFGNYFKKQIIQFQKDFELPANGSVDAMTRQKIEERFTGFYQPQHEGCNIETLVKEFKRLGFDVGESAEMSHDDLGHYIIKFQSFYNIEETGLLDSNTLNKINDILKSPLQAGKKHKDVITLKQDLNRLGYGNIRVTNKFGHRAEKKLMRFQGHYGLPVSGIADDLTLEKIQHALKVREKVTYSNYDVALSEVLDQEQKGIEDGRADLEMLLDPNSHINDEEKKFLFLDLFKPNVMSAGALNKFLEGKGVLEGAGQHFIDAGNHSGINELFLLAHALTETKQGFYPKSTETPVDEDGDVTYTEIHTNGENVKIPGITSETNNVVYDIYGLSENAEYDYIKAAIDNSWVTLSQAIIGGAEQVKNNYDPIDNTLYKMYRNPAGFSRKISQAPSVDFDWIKAAMEELYTIYQSLETYTLYLEIPVYKDQPVNQYIRG